MVIIFQRHKNGKSTVDCGDGNAKLVTITHHITRWKTFVYYTWLYQNVAITKTSYSPKGHTKLLRFLL